MEFEAFALLLSTPVHEQTVTGVHQQDRDDHVHKAPEGCDAGQEPGDQAE